MFAHFHEAHLLVLRLQRVCRAPPHAHTPEWCTQNASPKCSLGQSSLNVASVAK